MKSYLRTCAVIVAAGSSKRMGFDKITVPLLKLPLIAHTLQAFARCQAITDVVLVAASGRVEEFETYAASWGGGKVRKVALGGPERDVSVWNGLRAVPEGTDLIVVHDAARPLVSSSLITRLVEAAMEKRAVACAERVVETLQRADDSGRITDTVDRSQLWRMQTPQVFDARLLIDCYTKVLSEGKYVTDETMALRLCGAEVFLIENHDWNLKVTYPRDVPLVEFMLQRQGDIYSES